MKVLLGGALSALLCLSSVSAAGGEDALARKVPLKDKVAAAAVALVLLCAMKYGDKIHPTLDKHSFTAMKTYMITTCTMFMVMFTGLPREKASALLYATFVFCSNWMYNQAHKVKGEDPWMSYILPATFVYVVLIVMVFMLKRDDVLRTRRD